MNIGIDLGTTFSAVARIRQGQPEIIPNREGDRLTPSVVLIQEDGSAIVGSAAKAQAVILPHGVVTAVKNYMGTKEEFLLADGKRYPPEVISSYILQRLVQDAEHFAGERVEGAVITIPAYFTDAQRKATVDAAQLAKVPLLSVINEPTAAAVYYARCLGETQPMNLMIYDLGGGTFDVTILSVKGMNIQVLSTGGISRTGGKDFDMAIVEHVCQVFKEKHDIDLEDDEYLDEYQELILKAEICKEQLSSKESTSIPLRVGRAKENVVVTREFLETVVRKLYLRTEGVVKRAMRDAGLTTFQQIDRVVLVGGSSKIPLIQQSLYNLTGISPSSDVNPSEAVALGAAIYANNHCTVSDVCSHSIGVAAFSKGGQINHILIPRSNRLPCQVEESLYTMRKNQSSIAMTLTEGESTSLSDVTTISEQVIQLPDGLPEGTEVVITLSLDTNQLLHLQLRVAAADVCKEYTINRAQNMDAETLKKWQGLALFKEIF